MNFSAPPLPSMLLNKELNKIEKNDSVFNNRKMLFKDIEKGKKLKPTETVDKSKPLIGKANDSLKIKERNTASSFIDEISSAKLNLNKKKKDAQNVNQKKEKKENNQKIKVSYQKTENVLSQDVPSKNLTRIKSQIKTKSSKILITENLENNKHIYQKHKKDVFEEETSPEKDLVNSVNTINDVISNVRRKSLEKNTVEISSNKNNSRINVIFSKITSKFISKTKKKEKNSEKTQTDSTFSNFNESENTINDNPNMIYDTKNKLESFVSEKNMINKQLNEMSLGMKSNKKNYVSNHPVNNQSFTEENSLKNTTTLPTIKSKNLKNNVNEQEMLDFKQKILSIEDKSNRFNFPSEKFLPTPRVFNKENALKLYPAGRGSSVPLNLEFYNT